ncbi:excinuclease ABC subunit UvrB [bacterium]|nr:excinuclease ABC subunit UvrB [candidate division CSSED10-310 bacterium]
MNRLFRMTSDFLPCGDQPKAIEFLSQGIRADEPHQTLLGVTGSGKTYTMAKTIEAVQRPALIIAHNKTLAAQLYREFKNLFPDNAIHYFVSYYDYYQPEAYIASTDTYIEKDASINSELDRMRHAATRALYERKDVIIVASVSCIYGLGEPEDYSGLAITVEKNQRLSRRQLLEKLISLQFERNDAVLIRGKFRVRGDIVEVFGVGDDDATRIEFFGDEIERIMRIDPLKNNVLENLDRVRIFPATHYVTQSDRWPKVLNTIRTELEQQSALLESEGRLLERQRLMQRTHFDLEMLELTGYCAGIENYSRHLTGRIPGDPPPTLLDYLPENAVLFIDESHVTLPQLRAMFKGDRARKNNLIHHGFRLPSARDNRPLTFEEFSERVYQRIYVSATPSDYEIGLSRDRVVEQLIRPTGLLDPVIHIRPAHGQVDDLYDEIRIRAEKNERSLVTTLTKKMAENLTDYFIDLGLKVRYLHSDITTLERIKIIRDLRLGSFDALIGVNLLREGLDLPEVSLVAVLDADQEGFLRSTNSLIQTIGRCARHVDGQVILYADKTTNSIRAATEETERRRQLQAEYNEQNGITPQSIRKRIESAEFGQSEADYYTIPTALETDLESLSIAEIEDRILLLEKEMLACAKELKFERAAALRDQMLELREMMITPKRIG